MWWDRPIPVSTHRYQVLNLFFIATKFRAAKTGRLSRDFYMDADIIPLSKCLSDCRRGTISAATR
jgi:hypothetical protein